MRRNVLLVWRLVGGVVQLVPLVDVFDGVCSISVGGSDGWLPWWTPIFNTVHLYASFFISHVRLVYNICLNPLYLLGGCARL